MIPSHLGEALGYARNLGLLPIPRGENWPVFGDPVQWKCCPSSVLEFRRGEVTRLVLAVDRSRALDHVCRAMVEKVDHLRLVQREHASPTSGKDVTVQVPAILLQLLAGVEQIGVVGHVEKVFEPNTPSVAVGLCLVP